MEEMGEEDGQWLIFILNETKDDFAALQWQYPRGGQLSTDTMMHVRDSDDLLQTCYLFFFDLISSLSPEDGTSNDRYIRLAGYARKS